MRSPRIALVAVGASVITAVAVAFAPLGTSCTTSAIEPGDASVMSASVERCTGVSLFQAQGAWVLVVAVVPVALSVIALLARRRAVTVAAAVMLWIGCAVSLASVGLFFVPAAILLTLAARREEARAVTSLA